MLFLDQDNEISFKVAISGTDNVPSVRMVLSLDPMVIYTATPIKEESGKWSVNVKLPQSTKPGKYDFAIEATVGDRLFVPLKSTIEVGQIEVAVEGLEFNGAKVSNTQHPAPKSTVVNVQAEMVTIDEPEFVQEDPVEIPAKVETKNTGIGDLLLSLLRDNKTKPATTVESVKRAV